MNTQDTLKNIGMALLLMRKYQTKWHLFQGNIVQVWYLSIWTLSGCQTWNNIHNYGYELHLTSCIHKND